MSERTKRQNDKNTKAKKNLPSSMEVECVYIKANMGYKELARNHTMTDTHPITHKSQQHLFV